jgi:sulfate adenylyltransferase
MSKLFEYTIDYDTISEIINIGNKAFDPLKGFMDSADYKSVVENMHLDNGTPWTLPITLDIPENMMNKFIKSNEVILVSNNNLKIAQIFVEDVYKIDYENDIKKVFGTDNIKHPGVFKEKSRSKFRVGGKINYLGYKDDIFPEHSYTPEETKKKFDEFGWKTITGFQTRNPIHRAHEYLQRVGMELTDGIFIHPLIGWKKGDDFSPVAVVKSYEKMVESFYPKNRVLLSVLKIPMRYAGPREAVFHAIIRRNYGCTHFIVGRDHAGVGNFYEKYAAHELCKQFNNLGIEILYLCGPYYCEKCECIVTEKTCPHGEEFSLNVSGTHLRSLFSSGKIPSEKFMRKEISEVLLNLSKEKKLFVGKDLENV